MFGINGGELIVLLVVAAIVIGPERLPGYAEQLGQWVRRARAFVTDAKSRMDDEFGDVTGSVDWAALDPRRYDPRRIVADALRDDPTRPAASAGPGAGAVVSAAGSTGSAGLAGPVGSVGSVPYDDEAT